MGHTLSTPITEKHSSTGHNARLAFAASAMQGWRTSKGLRAIVLCDPRDQRREVDPDNCFFNN
jgi:hypothetical protein